MKMFRNLLLLPALSAVLLIASCEKESDKTRTVFTVVNAPMNGTQARPVTPSPATGSITATYDKSAKTLTYTVKYQNLLRKPLFITLFGPAEKGYNAYSPAAPGPTFLRIAQNFSFNQSGSPALDSLSGTFTASIFIDGTTFNEADVINGRYYITVRTPSAVPALNAATLGFGEIRGQIEFQLP
jgi:CHRD domain